MADLHRLHPEVTREQAYREDEGTNGDLGVSKQALTPTQAGSTTTRLAEGDVQGPTAGGDALQRREEAADGGPPRPVGLATPAAAREPRRHVDAATQWQQHEAATTVAAIPAAYGASSPVARPGAQGASSAGSTPRGAYAAGAAAAAMRLPGALTPEGAPMRGVARSARAPGLTTFGNQYMPFAAGFAQMAGGAPVYRSSRLHAVNPTAAITEDTSYMYTLDSGRETAATLAANPDHPNSEHVRNTRAGTRGGVAGRLFAPIR